MYSLLVYYSSGSSPDETVELAHATEVVARIPELLAKHPGCERIAVVHNGVPLYAVDCKGARID